MINPVNESSHIGHGTGCSCCSGGHNDHMSNEISRRKFVKITGSSALGAVAMTGLSWSALSSNQTSEKYELKRKALIVKPIFTHEVPVRREQSSWRMWGGIQSEKDVDQELLRIQGELKTLQSKADFPVEFLPIARVRKKSELNSIEDLQSADLFLVYAASGWMDIFDELNTMGKNMIFFCRHKSGPLYYWYEGISARFLRKHTDKLALSGIDENDVVIDIQDEILWRLRALCGLKNTLNAKIIAIGGASAFAQPEGVVPNLAKEKYKLDIQTVSYEELAKLINEARADRSVISRAKSRTDEYLMDSTIKLETKRQFVENCFVLEDVLTRIMKKFNCRTITTIVAWAQ